MKSEAIHSGPLPKDFKNKNFFVPSARECILRKITAFGGKARSR